MPALTWGLLGVGLAVLPGPALARRRLAWIVSRRADPAALRSSAGQWQVLRRLGGQAMALGWLAAAVAGAGAGAAVSAVAGPLAGLLAAVSGCGLVRCGRLLSTERDGERCRAELAALVAVLRDEYSAGATVGAAFTAAAALPGRFQAAVGGAAELARGGHDVTPALAAQRGLASLAVACDLAARSGAPLARSLAGVQAELAADQRAYRAVRAALAGPRSSALLLSGLPLVGLAMGSGMGAHPERVLLHTGAGQLALATGVLLDLAGLAWTLLLSRRALATGPPA